MASKVVITPPSPVLHRASSRWGRFQCGKDDGGGLLDDLQALGQQGSIAVVQVDVISGRGSGFETNCFADNEGDSLGLRLAYNLTVTFFRKTSLHP
jgi:hypothetical protein